VEEERWQEETQENQGDRETTLSCGQAVLGEPSLVGMLMKRMHGTKKFVRMLKASLLVRELSAEMMQLLCER
jgi:hypothetical protein